MTNLSNKPAFPAMNQDRFIEGGMTLREYYAGLAMQAMISRTTEHHGYDARFAVDYADALIAALEAKPQWTKFADQMPPANTPIWISNPRNDEPGFQFQHTRFNASAKDWISAGWTHWMPATNVPTKPKEGE